ncbi:MAG: hypothetical protein AB1473_20050 [Thermodesulfobacteriota bacterium]
MSPAFCAKLTTSAEVLQLSVPHDVAQARHRSMLFLAERGITGSYDNYHYLRLPKTVCEEERENL